MHSYGTAKRLGVSPHPSGVSHTRLSLPLVLGCALALFPALQADAQPSPPWLQGAVRSVAGEPIGYHSALPGARDAILVRSLHAEGYIEWETQAVPEDFTREEATFMWLASYDSTLDTRTWEMAVNGETWFSFRNDPAPDWSVAGPGGSELRYVRTGLDQHGDVQGFHFLTIPADRLVRGAPLRLRVTGESAASRTWYMVFLHQPQSSVSLRAEPAVSLREGRRLQRLRAAITHVGPPGEASIVTDGAAPLTADLSLGLQTFYLDIPAVDEPTLRSVDVRIGQETSRHDVLVKPVRPFELWFLPHSHVDIGYTHPQEEVLQLQWRNLEKGIDLARRTAAYPDGSRFRWNAEVMWIVDEYLRRGPEPGRKALVEAVKQGWVGLDGLYGNQLTGLQRAEELYRTAGENIRDLIDQHGFVIESAMISDVPGYSWGLVPALAQNGIRYFSVGPNHISGLPHNGDRVGYTLEEWGDRPFWWEGPGGNDRVLFWMSAHGYSWFHAGNLGSLQAESASAVLEYLETLDERGYPYDMVQLRYTIGGDNGPPDENMPDFIRRWNETHETPKMRIATTAEMFRAFEQRYGDQLPVHRGELSPYWEDGAASSSHETAVNRNTADRLTQAEVLWAAGDPARVPHDRFREAWKNVILYSEHTWGAHNSISEPEIPFVRVQWEGKKAFADSAAAQADRLVREALPGAGVPPAGVVGHVEVTNTSSWPRTDLVRVPADWRLRGDVIRDASGQAVRAQRLSTGEFAFVARDIPPFGSSVFAIEPGRPDPATPAGWATTEGMSDGKIDLKFDPLTGAVASLRIRGVEGDLVNPDFHRGLNQYIYTGRNAERPQSNREATFEVLDNGPLVYTVAVASDAPGARRLIQEIRLIEGLDRIEFVNRVDKELVYEKENVRFAFPFRLEQARIQVDAPWGSVRPDRDQLAGANKNYFSAERYVDISGAGAGVTWVTLDAPLVELGGMVGEAWMSHPSRPWLRDTGQTDLLYSWVMNNSWHTNYRAGQEGMVVFRYIVHAQAHADEPAVKRFATERSQPLVVVPVGAGTVGRPSILSIGAADDVLVTSLRASRDGKGRILRLFNAADGPRPFSWQALPGRGRVFRSSPAEERGDPVGQGELVLAPKQVVTLRLE